MSPESPRCGGFLADCGESFASVSRVPEDALHKNHTIWWAAGRDGRKAFSVPAGWAGQAKLSRRSLPLTARRAGDGAFHPRAGDDWRSRRDERIRLPLDEAIFAADDGSRYLRPELVLLMKARLTRPKDERDLAAILPLLELDRRAWLQHTLEFIHPGHPWLARVRGDS